MENQLVKNLDTVVVPLKYTSNKIKGLVKETEKKPPHERVTIPSSWIKAIRQAYNMPLSFIARGIGKTPQAIMDFEKSEESKKISLENLSKIADAMGMELMYGFVPKGYYPSLDRFLQSVAWYKTQENIRAQKENLGVSMKSNKGKYSRKKKESSVLKAANPQKSLWK